jgi:hypothetical protein
VNGRCEVRYTAGGSSGGARNGRGPAAPRAEAAGRRAITDVVGKNQQLESKVIPCGLGSEPIRD